MSRLILQEDFLLLDNAFQLKVLIADVIIRFKNGHDYLIDKIEVIRNTLRLKCGDIWWQDPINDKMVRKFENK